MLRTTTARDNRKPIQRRAIATRARFLDRLGEHIETTPFREFTVTGLARDMNLTPASFYRYFADFNQAVTELADLYRSRAQPLPIRLGLLVQLIDTEAHLSSNRAPGA